MQIREIEKIPNFGNFEKKNKNLETTKYWKIYKN